MTITILNAVFAYFENRLSTDLALDLWPNGGDSYREKWERRFDKGLTHAWGKMDRKTQRRFASLALEWEKQSKMGESLTLNIALGNSALRQEDGSLDFGKVSTLLADLSARVENGQTEIAVKEDNGNTVGRLVIVPD